jgi:hypothetical protein
MRQWSPPHPPSSPRLSRQPPNQLKGPCMSVERHRIEREVVRMFSPGPCQGLAEMA